MRDTIGMDSITPVSARLKEARAASGLSTRTVEVLIKKRFPGLSISHASIANFEKGQSSPGIDVIGALAMVYDRPINWFLTAGPSLTGVCYRSLSSKTGVKDRQRYEGQAQYLLEAYIRLERRLSKPLTATKLRPEITTDTTAEEAAERVRKHFKYHDAPIPSVVEVLERLGIRTIEVPTELNIDGFAAMLGGEPVIVLNPSTANDRCRLNAAHELGHVVFGDCNSRATATRDMDNKAFEFACHLLIPKRQLEEAFKGRSAVQLVKYKERFGISMAAMIYRAEKAGILDEQTTKRLWIQFARNGWRAKEPGRVRADRAFRFETLIDLAFSEKFITTWSEAADITGVSSAELRRRRNLAMGIPDEEEGGVTLRIRE